MITGQVLADADSGRALIGRVMIADTFLDRLRGLLGRPPLDPDQGLWLEPCNSVHMFGMRTALDVVFLDAQGAVLRLIPALRPWRVSPIVRRAKVAVELAPGSIARLGLTPGQRLLVRAPEGRRCPRRRPRPRMASAPPG